MPLIKNAFSSNFIFYSYPQHTLVTEIRELIFPEDRPRYDELVYRRSKTSSRVDYYDTHRVSFFAVSSIRLSFYILLCLSFIFFSHHLSFVHFFVLSKPFFQRSLSKPLQNDVTILALHNSHTSRVHVMFSRNHISSY
jgi:hypothetical protein